MGQQTICSKARPANGSVQDRVGPPQLDPAARSALKSEPAAPWMEEVALEVWVDLEHSPVFVRLSGTLNQSTAINVVPVVKELMADEGREIELQTPGLDVPDAGGTEALVELQRLVQHSGGRFTWGETLSELSVSDRRL